jgi:hypothetical protein
LSFIVLTLALSVHSQRPILNAVIPSAVAEEIGRTLALRVPRDLIMSLAMKQMARTGDNPSRWIYEHHIDWNEPVYSPS